MVINIIIGFIIPWIAGAFFIKRDVIFVLKVSIIASLISFLFNDIGYYMNWWYVTPKQYANLAFIPFNFGIFSLIAVAMIYFINKSNKVWSMILLFTFGKTFLESILVFCGKVVYGNGWNLAYTFLSYFVACTIGYFLYKCISKPEHS